MLLCIVTDNLYRVLVCTYSTVSTKAVELCLEHSVHNCNLLLWWE